MKYSRPRDFVVACVWSRYDPFIAVSWGYYEVLQSESGLPDTAFMNTCQIWSEIPGCLAQGNYLNYRKRRKSADQFN